MNKEIKLIIIIFISLILIIIILIGGYNLIQDKNGEENIITVENNNTSKMIELERLPKEYTVEQAIKDRCVYVAYVNSGTENTNIKNENVKIESKVYNLEMLENFINNFQNSKNDMVRIVFVTYEGDICIKDLELKDGNITIRSDCTRDKYASEEDRKIKTNVYDKNQYQLLIEENFENNILYLENISKDFDSRIYIYKYPKENSYNLDFELIFKARKDTGIKTIVEKGTKYDYNIYTYAGDVYVKINEEEIPLKEAIEKDKINIEGIINNAVIDAQEKKIESHEYSDGGTRQFIYNTGKEKEPYSIIKCFTLDGNRDVYIGVPQMFYSNGTVKYRIIN